MRAATIAACLLVLSAGCLVQTTTESPTATPSTAERLEEDAETPTAPGTPSASAYDVDVTRIEDLVHEEMNARREAHGVETLARSEKLDAIARYKSWDMAQRDYFAHKGPENQRYGYLRERYAGSCGVIGQNLHRSMNNAQGTQTQESLSDESQIATTAVNSLMNSTGHRRNILEPNYSVEGIGVFVDERGTIYLTQEFCG